MKMPAYRTLATVIVLPFLFGFNNSIKSTFSADRIIFKVKPVPNSKTFILRAYNLRREKTTIKIKNEKEQVYITRKITGRNGYRELFNLNDLRTGYYHIEINHPYGKRIKTIKLTKKSVKVIEATERNACLPDMTLTSMFM